MTEMGTLEVRKINQKSNTLRMCGTSFSSISDNLLLFTLSSIFLHSPEHAGHPVADLL